MRQFLGTVPKLRPPGMKRKKSIKVNFDDMQEKFTRIKPGLMTSESTRELNIEGREDRMITKIKQTIEFVPNCLDDSRIARVASLNTTRNFIVYDKKDEVHRLFVFPLLRKLI